ncbi:MAG: hypothetical protein HY316_11190 [Acidobacteria bacterium]|nr:hypothetical protein [Acidobacteriota bacterium]
MGNAISADRNQFIGLFNETYSRQMPPSYYDWRFCSPASRGGVLLAGGNEQLGGTCGYHLCDTRVPRASTSLLVVDLMVAPELRGTGLVFARLRLEIERLAVESGAECVFLFPNRAGAAAWLASDGWGLVAEIATCESASREKPLSTGLGFARVSSFGDWVDSIEAEFALNHPELAFVKREARYLNWRFASHPVHRYEVFRVDRGVRPLAYVVLKVFRDSGTGQSFGDVVDMLWAEDDPELLAGLLRFARARFYEMGVWRVTTWLQTHTLLDDLGRDEGFVETDQIRHFCCKVLDTRCRWLADAGRWFITMGDAEIY